MSQKWCIVILETAIIELRWGKDCQSLIELASYSLSKSRPNRNRTVPRTSPASCASRRRGPRELRSLVITKIGDFRTTSILLRCSSLARVARARRSGTVFLVASMTRGPPRRNRKNRNSISPASRCSRPTRRRHPRVRRPEESRVRSPPPRRLPGGRGSGRAPSRRPR